MGKQDTHRSVLPMVLVLVSACSATSIDVARFDQSCEHNDDCVPVQTDDICSPSCSADAAINSSEADRYEDERERLLAECLYVRQLSAVCDAAIVGCVDGLCVVDERPDESGEGEGE